LWPEKAATAALVSGERSMCLEADRMGAAAAKGAALLWRPRNENTAYLTFDIETFSGPSLEGTAPARTGRDEAAGISLWKCRLAPWQRTR